MTRTSFDTFNRRSFLQGMAGASAALLSGGALQAKSLGSWRKQIGIELYTVRTLLAKDFEGTIAKVAAIGYREVEPVGYGDLDPKAFRALLDRYKLTAPSTHTSATEGPNLEKELEGHQIMGFKYTQIRSAPAPRPAAPAPGTPRPAPAPRAPMTVESVKRSAEAYNRQGAIAKKFGMKVLIHNHAGEFNKLEGGELTQYDILLKETDPALVTMQIDIGWATIAGKNIFEMFEKNPGRYELWHVKDVTGLKALDMSVPPGQRRAKFMPIGQGEVDYRKIFAKAGRAGLKYFVIEQDNAGQDSGDIMADIAANYKGLVKVLS